MHPTSDTDYFGRMLDNLSSSNLIDQIPSKTMSFTASDRMDSTRDNTAERILWKDRIVLGGEIDAKYHVNLATGS